MDNQGVLAGNRRGAFRRFVLACAHGIFAFASGAAADVVPVGSEFQVNTYTTSDQGAGTESYGAPQRVSRSGDGSFVIVWSSYGQEFVDGGDGVFAQRFAANGAAVGTEFQVNSYTSYYQNLPVVAHVANSGFVVVWQSDDQDGSYSGIFAQRYNANGSKAGGEFRVNSYTTSYQREPSIAATADGGFVVAWRSSYQDGDDLGVFAQRYDAKAARLGTEFQVNSYTTGSQGYKVAVATSATGFVIVWESIGQDGSGYGIFGQRFDTTGAMTGTEFQVNTYTTGRQSAPHVGMDTAGNALVVWDGPGPTDPVGIYARRYAPSGIPLADQFAIGSGNNPTVAMDDNGSFLVAFADDSDGNDSGISSRHFDAAGLPTGAAFVVNSYTTDFQTLPSVATDGNGRFVVTWIDYSGHDGDSRGMFAQRLGLDADGDAVADEADNCPAAANPDQLNSDCLNPTLFVAGGCTGTVASEDTGCCDGGDVCDDCPAQRDNTLCDSARSAGATIGPDGGVIHTDEVNGTVSASVSIPAGALEQDTSISITENGPASSFALRREGGTADVMSVSLRPEGQAFALPVQVTLRWDDRDKDGVVDRGVCGIGADVGLPCDEDADCANNSCSVNSSIPEDNLIVKRNNSRFSKSGFGVSPFTCADHLAGSGCELATADCADADGTGQATVAKCCDPGAGPSGTRTYGEWTFETCDFSEFLVGLNASALVPGTGKPETDCMMEWAPHNPLNGRYLDNKLLPNFKQTCRDGDPACDEDGLANGTCFFTIGLCAVVDEPRLTDDGVEECASAPVAKFRILKPTLDSVKAEEVAAVSALLAIGPALGPGVLDLPSLEFTYDPLLAGGDVCGASALFPLPLRDGIKKNKVIIKTSAEGPVPKFGSHGVRDTDKLKLTCLPPF